MKLTEEKLKQLIREMMYTPSTHIQDALADPDVHQKIKDLLSSMDKEEVNQGLSLLFALYPDKYGEGDIDDRLTMGRQAYDQMVDTGMGDSVTRSSTDHARLGSWEHGYDFKNIAKPRTRNLSNLRSELEEFYNVNPPMARRLQIYSTEKTFYVESRGTSREDLYETQGFHKFMSKKGYEVTPIEMRGNVTYEFKITPKEDQNETNRSKIKTNDR